MNNEIISDIPRNNWVDKWLPSTIRPYARLARFDRPIGTWLLLFPCWWSLALALKDSANLIDVLWLFILFGIGAKVMRGAGCCLNDIIDRDFDSNVARTKDRPIPAGAVSVKQAIFFMVILSTIGLTVLLEFNNFTIGLGVGSMLLIVIYPFCKRYTYWPQLILGLAFNWGALMGWAAIHGEIQIPSLTLYLAGIFWTLGYDTIYALQDKDDDLIIGIKSTALVLKRGIRGWLYVFYGLAIFFMMLSGWLVGLSWPFYVGIFCAALQAIWQIKSLIVTSPNDCLAKFKSNRLFSWLFLFGIIVSQIQLNKLIL